MLQLNYAVMTLAGLWALGGGHLELFWPRQYLLALILLVLLFVFRAMRARSGQPFEVFRELRQPTRTEVRTGLVWGLGLGVAFGLVVFGLSRGLPNFVDAPAIRPTSFVHLLFFALILSPLLEVHSRRLLQPAWGLGNVAFLDALTVGFGTQKFFPFIVAWAAALGLGWIFEKKGIFTAVAVRVGLSLFGLLALYLG